MNIQVKQCNSGNYTSGRGGRAIEWIVVHYTGAAGSAKNNADYFANNSTCNASAHYFIDGSGTIWQSVADWDTAWHAGNFVFNQKSLGIEVCSNGEPFSAAEVAELAELVRYKMNELGIDADHVIRHYDVADHASGTIIDPHKTCPAPYVYHPDWWEQLHEVITTGNGDVPTPEPEPEPEAGKLAVDGWWGMATTAALQRYLGTYEDGIVSGQYDGYQLENPGLLDTSWEWKANPTGSAVIRALQAKVGANIDGIAGSETFACLQKRLGTYVDGTISAPSACVKALQAALNAGML